MNDPTRNCTRERCTRCVNDACRRACFRCGAPAFYGGGEAAWWCSACYQRTFFPESVSNVGDGASGVQSAREEG